MCTCMYCAWNVGSCYARDRGHTCTLYTDTHTLSLTHPLTWSPGSGASRCAHEDKGKVGAATLPLVHCAAEVCVCVCARARVCIFFYIFVSRARSGRQLCLSRTARHLWCVCVCVSVCVSVCVCERERVCVCVVCVCARARVCLCFFNLCSCVDLLVTRYPSGH